MGGDFSGGMGQEGMKSSSISASSMSAGGSLMAISGGCCSVEIGGGGSMQMVGLG